MTDDEKTVAQCPHCGAGYTFEAVKTLFGRAGRAIQLTPRRKPLNVQVQVPCCKKLVSVDDILTMWGRAKAARRTTFGAGPGRPKNPDRCPCGAMTSARAEKRKHICQAPAPPIPINVARKRKPMK